MGIIANEIEMFGIGLNEGSKSKMSANAAKNEISINASKLNFFKIKSPL